MPTPLPEQDLTDSEQEALSDLLRTHEGVAGALLPLLHAVQDRLGCIPAAAVPQIAAALDRSTAEIHGVLTFYPDFRRTPAGRHVIRICCAEACQAVGSASLVQHAQRALGTVMPGTDPTRRFTLEAVYCLGNCACGPSLLLDDELHALVTPQRFDELVDGCQP